MKRLQLCFFVLLLAGLCGHAKDIYVSPTGSDANDGSKEKPLATLNMAIRKARELRRLNDPSVSGGIHIILKGGMYTLNETILVRPEDSGTADSPTVIEAAPGELPVLSGGVFINGWKKATVPSGLPASAKGKVWVADVPLVNGRLFDFRQLWINANKAVRAKSANGDQMHRILDWNNKDESCWIPTLGFPSLQNASGIEMFIHQWWAIAILRIRKMEVHGDRTKLYFRQPESKIQNEHPWPAPWLSAETGNSAFYLVNAIQFLDEPGEWWLDVINRKIYYWPRNNENLPAARVVAPYIETLIRIEGTIDHPVSNIFFEGISFQNTGWLRPSQQGHVPLQEGMYMTEAYKLRPAGTKEKLSLDNQAWVGRPVAAIEVFFTDKLDIENCRFEHLASTALDYCRAVHGSRINGNLFKDIGGTAILAGVYSDPGSEVHLPYHPKDEREVVDAIIITNNLITDATNEDWSCVGIGMGYVRNTTIENNEVENVSYTGISMGWGWTAAENVMKNNIVSRNKVHHYGKHNYDCSGIYTLSAQPASVINENYIDSIYIAPYAHLPSHWFYLYADEGSSFVTVKDNWTPSTKFLQNANGPGSQWSNNGPTVPDSIKMNAGLKKEYRHLAKERTTSKISLAINQEHAELVEITVSEGTSIDLAKLKYLLSENKIDSNAVYEWQNHYVIFGKIPDPGVLRGKLKNSFARADVKIYYDLFYEYSMRKRCPDKIPAKEWDHIILTADLVRDTKKQREYLDYHASQFEKWPEIAKGFCNADFQQLLLFRNGTQLMLVISIPKGESLDRLNPKTTQNNPRVVEWNKIMSKYQRGNSGNEEGRDMGGFEKSR